MRTITVSIKPPADRTEPVSQDDISEGLIQFARVIDASDLSLTGTVELPNEWLAYWHISEWPQ